MDSQRFMQFCTGLEKHIRSEFSDLLAQNTEAEELAIISKHLQSSLLVEDGTEIRNTNEEIRLRTPAIDRKRDLLKYAILSWFMPPLTQFELQEVLRTKSRQHHFWEIESYLHSFEVCCLQLFLETDYLLNDVFGNILQKNISIWIRLDSGQRRRVTVPDQIDLYLWRPRSPKRKIRRRGYNDHGSRPEVSEIARKKAMSEDEYLKQKQLSIELRRTEEFLQSSNRILKAKNTLSKWGLN